MKNSMGVDLTESERVLVECYQNLVKVLKALAEYLDLSLGDLLEGIVLHAFDGKAPFTAQTREHIARLKSVYGLILTAENSHRLTEEDDARR